MDAEMDCPTNCTSANNSQDELTEATMNEYDDFLRNSRFVIQRVLIPIICILGILVNSLTILVFSQRRLRCSTNIYLRALAAFDLLYLTSVLILSFYHYAHHQNFLYYKPYGLFISDFASNTSVWLTAAFTIERFFVVSNPMKNLKYASAQFAQRIAVLIACACFFCTLSTLFEHRVVQAYNNQTETFSLHLQPTDLGESPNYMLFISTFSAIFFVLIPFITIASLNVFLIYSLRQARNIRSSLSPAIVASELRTTLLLVVVVLMFLLCQGPAATFMLVSQFVDMKDGLQRGLGNIFNLLVAVNACGNFFLYVGLSAKFRTTFLGLLFSRISAKLLPRSLRERAGPADAGYGGSHYHHPTGPQGQYHRTYDL